MLSQERLRTIIWEIGQRDLAKPAQDFVVLNMVHPHLGHAYWHIQQQSVAALELNAAFHQAERVLRVYDVTEVDFDGGNAHRFFDREIQQWIGNYYFGVDHQARNYLAEVGLRNQQGGFQAVARSAPTFFDRDQPVDGSLLNGLFAVGGTGVSGRFADYSGSHLIEHGSGSTQ
ncbi:MAG: DUF4912 domain-containing protein [Candidatus Competibacteraceae bacterium]|jgi:hypothetical protein|nr:DUF4912 domain-containing protein [Candidatus Competibacteraceae bacterium]